MTDEEKKRMCFVLDIMLALQEKVSALTNGGRKPTEEEQKILALSSKLTKLRKKKINQGSEFLPKEIEQVQEELIKLQKTKMLG